MLIPILGELVTALGLMLCTYFENTPMEVAGVTEALFPGLTGQYLDFEMEKLILIKTNMQVVGLLC